MLSVVLVSLLEALSQEGQQEMVAASAWAPSSAACGLEPASWQKQPLSLSLATEVGVRLWAQEVVAAQES